MLAIEVLERAKVLSQLLIESVTEQLYGIKLIRTELVVPIVHDHMTRALRRHLAPRSRARSIMFVQSSSFRQPST